MPSIAASRFTAHLSRPTQLLSRWRQNRGLRARSNSCNQITCETSMSRTNSCKNRTLKPGTRNAAVTIAESKFKTQGRIVIAENVDVRLDTNFVSEPWWSDSCWREPEAITVPSQFQAAKEPQIARRHSQRIQPCGWRVALLPFLGEQELFRQYRFDEE